MADIEVLIERWRNGDERAAEALYNQYRESIYRLAYALLNDGGDAEEVMQDAMTYALTNIRRFDPSRAQFRTWLHTITVSRCRDRQRRKRLPSVSLTAWLKRGHDLPDSAPHPEHTVSRSEARSRVWQAIQTLKPALREAILLRYWAGHTYREMAEALGCPLPTAQSRVRLAYKQLRALLAPADMLDLEQESVR